MMRMMNQLMNTANVLLIGLIIFTIFFYVAKHRNIFGKKTPN
jgi:uncharacterized membrane-anchored protein